MRLVPIFAPDDSPPALVFLFPSLRNPDSRIKNTPLTTPSICHSLSLSLSLIFIHMILFLKYFGKSTSIIRIISGMGFRVIIGFLQNSSPGGVRFPQSFRISGCLEPPPPSQVCCIQRTGVGSCPALPQGSSLASLASLAAWAGCVFLTSLGVREGCLANSGFRW